MHIQMKVLFLSKRGLFFKDFISGFVLSMRQYDFNDLRLYGRLEKRIPGKGRSDCL